MINKIDWTQIVHKIKSIHFKRFINVFVHSRFGMLYSVLTAVELCQIGSDLWVHEAEQISISLDLSYRNMFLMFLTVISHRKNVNDIAYSVLESKNIHCDLFIQKYHVILRRMHAIGKCIKTYEFFRIIKSWIFSTE